MNMVKGAMWDAAQVADEFEVGIAVRGTGLLAHMGIESGDPTKAQEFKNKTSKEVDLVLCEEMEWAHLGAVVHYDPRLEWSSHVAEINAGQGRSPMFVAAATKADWEKKKLRIPERLRKLGPRLKVPSDAALEAAFMGRSREYMEEDHEYRKGHYAPHTTLVGPYVRLKVRSDANMVGDHDLFAFTGAEGKDYGVFIPDSDARVASAQKALQYKPTFQVQHGGIWYWKPGTGFNVGIKQKIMGAHGPDGDEPLVYVRPGKQVTAAYYATDDKLEIGLVQPGLDQMAVQDPQWPGAAESQRDPRRLKRRVSVLDRAYQMSRPIRMTRSCSTLPSFSGFGEQGLHLWRRFDLRGRIGRHVCKDHSDDDLAGELSRVDPAGAKRLRSMLGPDLSGTPCHVQDRGNVGRRPACDDCKGHGIPPFRRYPGILNAGAITAFASFVRLMRIFRIG